MTTRADEELGPRIQELEARLADLLAERRALTKTVKRERRNEFNDYETLEFRDRPPNSKPSERTSKTTKSTVSAKASWRTPRSGFRMAICTPCTASARQSDTTPNRSRWASMN